MLWFNPLLHALLDPHVQATTGLALKRHTCCCMQGLNDDEGDLVDAKVSDCLQTSAVSPRGQCSCMHCLLTSVPSGLSTLLLPRKEAIFNMDLCSSEKKEGQQAADGGYRLQP